MNSGFAGEWPDILQELCEYLRSPVNNDALLSSEQWTVGVLFEQEVPNSHLSDILVTLQDNTATIGLFPVGQMSLGVTVWGKSTDSFGDETRAFATSLAKKLRSVRSQDSLARCVVGVEGYSLPAIQKTTRPEAYFTVQLIVAANQLTRRTTDG